MMTAAAIDALRKKLGLTQKEFVRLFGLAKGVSYRWLLSHEDQLREEVLLYLHEVVSWPAAKRAAKIRAVKRALKARGPLAAGGALLIELAEPLLRRAGYAARGAR